MLEVEVSCLEGETLEVVLVSDDEVVEVEVGG